MQITINGQTYEATCSESITFGKSGFGEVRITDFKFPDENIKTLQQLVGCFLGQCAAIVDGENVFNLGEVSGVLDDSICVEFCPKGIPTGQLCFYDKESAIEEVPAGGTEKEVLDGILACGKQQKELQAVIAANTGSTANDIEILLGIEQQGITCLEDIKDSFNGLTVEVSNFPEDQVPIDYTEQFNQLTATLSNINENGLPLNPEVAQFYSNTDTCWEAAKSLLEQANISNEAKLAQLQVLNQSVLDLKECIDTQTDVLLAGLQVTVTNNPDNAELITAVNAITTCLKSGLTFDEATQIKIDQIVSNTGETAENTEATNISTQEVKSCLDALQAFMSEGLMVEVTNQPSEIDLSAVIEELTEANDIASIANAESVAYYAAALQCSNELKALSENNNTTTAQINEGVENLYAATLDLKDCLNKIDESVKAQTEVLNENFGQLLSNSEAILEQLIEIDAGNEDLLACQEKLKSLAEDGNTISTKGFQVINESIQTLKKCNTTENQEISEGVNSLLEAYVECCNGAGVEIKVSKCTIECICWRGEIDRNGDIVTESPNNKIDLVKSNVSNGTGNNQGPGNRYTLSFSPAPPNEITALVQPLGELTSGEPNGAIDHVLDKTANSVTLAFNSGDDGQSQDEFDRFGFDIVIYGCEKEVVDDVVIV